MSEATIPVYESGWHLRVRHVISPSFSKFESRWKGHCIDACIYLNESPHVIGYHQLCFPNHNILVKQYRSAQTNYNMPYITEGEPKPIGSYPDSGIDVLIVGTGLAGLTAAIECRRKGHTVRILEKCPDINTQGECVFRTSSTSPKPMSADACLVRGYVLHGSVRHQILQTLA